MKLKEHLNIEELVAMYYRETAPGDTRSARMHMEDCAECAAAFRSLENDLKSLGIVDAPERDENYGERMWQRVAEGLPSTERLLSAERLPKTARPELRRKWRLGLWTGLSYAAGCAALAAAAFYVGTVWEHQQHLKREAAREAQHKLHPQQKPRVVVVVLGDHLDRSERLLVELKHADADNQELVRPLREEAKGLLAANQVFQEDAERSGDEDLSQALDKLEGLLKEIANEPGGLNAASLERLQQQMTKEGLLFEVRVLRSKNPYRETSVRLVANGGTA